MSIIIKGMKMPKSCEECQVCDYEEGNCLLTGTYLISDGRNTLPHNGERREWCPLVELPPHGRLIDADALHYSRIRIYHEDGTVGGYNAVVMSSEIKDAPTIIEVEEVEEWTDSAETAHITPKE